MKKKYLEMKGEMILKIPLLTRANESTSLVSSTATSVCCVRIP